MYILRMHARFYMKKRKDTEKEYVNLGDKIKKEIKLNI